MQSLYPIAKLTSGLYVNALHGALSIKFFLSLFNSSEIISNELSLLIQSIFGMSILFISNYIDFALS